ncbi:MAG: O-antigen ligase family protein [Candidatus Omnitrophota bacterium]
MMIYKKAGEWFDAVQFLVLLIISPLFIFPKTRFWWIFLIVPVLWTVRKILCGRFMERTPVDVPIFIFLVALLVTTLRVTDWDHSLPKIAGVFFAVAFFYGMAALLQTEKRIRALTFLFLSGGFLFGIVGLLGMPTFKEKHLHLLMRIKDRIPRIDFNLPGAELGFAPTVIGGILLLVIPLFLVMIYMTEGWKRMVPTLGLLITFGVLILTQSRGAWAGLVFSTLIIAFLIAFQWIQKKKKVVAITVAILLTALFITAVGIYTQSNAPQLRPGIKQAEGTLLFRLQLWDLTIPLIRDNPLWGIGLNNFRIQVPEVRFFLSHAHNQFLHIAAEMGIPASAAFLAILIATGFMCVHVWKHASDRWMKMTVLGLGWGQLAHFFFCLTDAIPPGAKAGLLFWISLGLITVIFKKTRGVGMQSPFEKPLLDSEKLL